MARKKIKKIKFVTVFGSARSKIDAKFYDVAQKIGSELAKNNFGLITGGGGGIMEAVNKGAFLNGGVSIGLNIILPHEQDLNPYCTHFKQYKNLSKRKQKLIKNSNIFIIMPGGFGTLDEVFEVLTLAQTGLRKHKIIFFDENFWGDLIKFFQNTLISNKMISKSDLKLYKVCNSVEEIIDYIKK